MQCGLHQLDNIWCLETQDFLKWNTVRPRFQLDEADYPRYLHLIEMISRTWWQWLT
jgi:hypothetical protein